MGFDFSILFFLFLCEDLEKWKNYDATAPIFLGSLLKFLSTITINIISLTSIFLPHDIPNVVTYKGSPVL